jgi:light-regulated signal transduction histidine kinase (bacteriophytochrome)
MDNTTAITKIHSLESMVVALTELLTVQEQVVSEQSERIMNDEEALRKSNERFLEFISETAMRLKTPLEVVEESIAFVVSEVESGPGDPANVALELKIQMKNLEQIRQNIIELNKAITEHSDEMSLATRKFLTE